MVAHRDRAAIGQRRHQVAPGIVREHDLVRQRVGKHQTVLLARRVAHVDDQVVAIALGEYVDVRFRGSCNDIIARHADEDGSSGRCQIVVARCPNGRFLARPNNRIQECRGRCSALGCPHAQTLVEHRDIAHRRPDDLEEGNRIREFDRTVLEVPSHRLDCRCAVCRPLTQKVEGISCEASSIACRIAGVQPSIRHGDLRQELEAQGIEQFLHILLQGCSGIDSRIHPRALSKLLIKDDFQKPEIARIDVLPAAARIDLVGTSPLQHQGDKRALKASQAAGRGQSDEVFGLLTQRRVLGEGNPG